MYILYKDNDSKIQPLVYIIIYVKEAQNAKGKATQYIKAAKFIKVENRQQTILIHFLVLCRVGAPQEHFSGINAAMQTPSQA